MARGNANSTHLIVLDGAREAWVPLACPAVELWDAHPNQATRVHTHFQVSSNTWDALTFLLGGIIVIRTTHVQGFDRFLAATHAKVSISQFTVSTQGKTSPTRVTMSDGNSKSEREGAT
jgi:hypothetical protein